jgi:hypothetical protein
VTGCSADAIAVVNETDQTFYMRYEGTQVWIVPPHASGIGPGGITSGAVRVEILSPDCSRLNMWGLHQPSTITIRNLEVSEIDGSAISYGVAALPTLKPTDDCGAETTRH